MSKFCSQLQKSLFLVSFVTVSFLSNAQFDETILARSEAGLIDPIDAEIADFDQDGLLDVVLADDNSNGNCVLYTNLGNRTYSNETVLGTGFVEVQVGDVNNDGFPDILGINQFNLIQVFINDQLGGFSESISYSGSWANPEVIRLADLNNDGFLDYILGSKNDGEVHIGMNLQDGGFDTPIQVDEGHAGLRSIAVEDYNGDGNLDIAWVATNDDEVGWLPNDGNGNFPNSIIISDTFDAGWELISFDYDGDSDQDILVIGYLGGVVSAFENNGAGSFTEEVIEEGPFLGRSINAGELTGDGIEDIIIGGGGNDLVLSVLPGLGGGNYGDQLPVLLSSDQYELFPGEVMDIELRDMDNDGELDIIATNQEKVWTSILYGPSFQGPALNLDQADFRNADFSDVDGDGDLDMLSASNTNGLSYYENDGAGNFLVRHFLPSQNSISAATFEDLDANGIDDILVRGNQGLSVVQNQGGGQFQLFALENSINSSAHITGDVDGDGDLDVFFVRDGSIWVTVNQGEFDFASPISIGAYGEAFDMDSGDLNNDGLADIALCSYSGNKVSLFENLGGLLFGEEQVLEGLHTGFASGVQLADLNGTGKDDIVYTSYLFDALLFQINMGEGEFSDIVEVGHLDGARGCRAADVDGDGDLDLFAGSVWENNLVYYSNEGEGMFDEQQVFSFIEPNYMAIADVDNNGVLDVVYANQEDKYIALIDPIALNGCNDPTACNFLAEQATDDGSCCYDQCGCTNSEACNFDSQATCDDGTCTFPGCDDPQACNYLPNAECSTDCFYNIDVCGICGGTSELAGCLDETACNYTPEADCTAICFYAGCTDDEACNYNVYAACDNGSCVYNGDLTGYVFEDQNNDGIYNSNGFWNEEPGLSNWQVEIEELGWIAYTDQNGFYVFNDVPFGDYTVTVSNIEEGWSVLEESSAGVTINTCPTTSVQFPMGWEGGEESFTIFGEGPSLAIYHCEFGFDAGVNIHNIGGVPLNGTISIAFEETFEAAISENDSYVPPSSIEPGLITWELNNQPSGGQSLAFYCHMIGPGVEFIDQFFDFEVTIEFVNGEGEQIYFDQLVYDMVVSCAYDPNDKATIEEGYTEENHFILKEDDMDYRIRFQNTGNFPAQNVVIRDTLDIEHLDISTFEPIGASHNFTTMLQPNGALTFTFLDIQLPDSTCCPLESQGQVFYRIRPKQDTEHGDVINNTAYIFFDGNPPIVTNTTYHTIYECTDALANFTSDEFEGCESSAFEVISTQDYIEDYQWKVDGELVGQAPELSLSELEPGEYELVLLAENPLCEAEQVETITIFESPELILTEDQDICEGESITLIGTVEGIEVWTQTITPEESATYKATYTNDFGCSSEESVTVGVNPLPEISAGPDQTICAGEEITLLATGDGTLVWEGTDQEEITVSPDQDAEYIAVATTDFDCIAFDEVFITVASVPEVFIQQNGNQLYYAGFESGDFQWFLNGELIEGAINADIVITQDGIYHLELTNNDGCLGVSGEIDAIWDGIEELGIAGVRVYPNPVQDFLTIEFTDAALHTVELYSAEGKLVLSQTNAAQIQRLDLSEFERGVYTLKVVGIKNAVRVVR